MVDRLGLLLVACKRHLDRTLQAPTVCKHTGMNRRLPLARIVLDFLAYAGYLQHALRELRFTWPRQSGPFCRMLVAEGSRRVNATGGAIVNDMVQQLLCRVSSVCVGSSGVAQLLFSRRSSICKSSAAPGTSGCAVARDAAKAWWEPPEALGPGHRHVVRSELVRLQEVQELVMKVLGHSWWAGRGQSQHQHPRQAAMSCTKRAFVHRL